jgi:hypothetical protein
LIESINAIERCIGAELFGEAERTSNYQKILDAIEKADENGE